MNYIILFIFSSSFFSSCSKPSDNPILPVTIISDNLNKWQCEIDGTSYGGTVDTSFLVLPYDFDRVDTVIICTGTSTDKKSHIHFRLSLNRTTFPENGVFANNNSYDYMLFDTSASNILNGNLNNLINNLVTYKLDESDSKSIGVSFDGNLIDQKRISHSIKGKFNCDFFTGNKNPNQYSCVLGSSKTEGYLTSAMVNANTLIMTGINYLEYPLQLFSISVRTGGTIKPGIYSSKNGDVGFYGLATRISNLGLYYVDDSVGSITLTIKSVKGNIVEGTFSGVKGYYPTFNMNQPGIEDGKFICRVNNYVPQEQYENRWQLGGWVEPSFGSIYKSYGGNITSAEKKINAGRYTLTINGESDNGTSVFKIVISDEAPIKRTYYRVNNDNFQKLDTIYFKSGMPDWEGNYKYLFVDKSIAPYGWDGTYCYIDSIDDNHVSGFLSGAILENLEDYLNLGKFQFREMHKANFNAKF